MSGSRTMIRAWRSPSKSSRAPRQHAEPPRTSAAQEQPMVEETNDAIIAATRTWIERAVIGLSLCPFAKAVYVKNQVRYAVSSARSTDALLDDLARELLN